MGYIVESFYADDKQILGSDGTMLAYDLKTLTGLYKRISKFHWKPTARKLHIYRQSRADRYKDNARLIKILHR